MQLLLLDKLLWHVLCISILQAISQLSWHQFSIELWTRIAVIIIYRGSRPDLDLHTWPPEGRLAKSEVDFKFIKDFPDPQDNADVIVNIVTDAWHCLSINCHYDVYLFSSSIQFPVSCEGLKPYFSVIAHWPIDQNHRSEDVSGLFSLWSLYLRPISPVSSVPDCSWIIPSPMLQPRSPLHFSQHPKQLHLA